MTTDGLKYDKDGFLIYEGLSPLHEDADIDSDAEESADDE